MSSSLRDSGDFCGLVTIPKTLRVLRVLRASLFPQSLYSRRQFPGESTSFAETHNDVRIPGGKTFQR